LVINLKKNGYLFVVLPLLERSFSAILFSPFRLSFP
jgi:hypothetical protein